MTKITLFMLFLSTLWGYSQVNRYTFANSAGTYTAISGGTVLGTELTDNERFVDPTALAGSTTQFTGAGLPIGFNFTFNGYVYDKFAVAADGWISLGTTALGVNIEATDGTKPMGSSLGTVSDILSAKIVAFGGDFTAQAGATLSYKTEGTAPNRVLIVQWKGYKRAIGYSGPTDNFNFQMLHLNGLSIILSDLGVCIMK